MPRSVRHFCGCSGRLEPSVRGVREWQDGNKGAPPPGAERAANRQVASAISAAAFAGSLASVDVKRHFQDNSHAEAKVPGAVLDFPLADAYFALAYCSGLCHASPQPLSLSPFLLSQSSGCNASWLLPCRRSCSILALESRLSASGTSLNVLSRDLLTELFDGQLLDGRTRYFRLCDRRRNVHHGPQRTRRAFRPFFRLPSPTPLTIAFQQAGYTHFDTASGYGSEEAVGKAIRDSGVAREKVFVTTKLACVPSSPAMFVLERSLSLPLCQPCPRERGRSVRDFAEQAERRLY